MTIINATLPPHLLDTLARIREEAEKTKPWHYSLLMAVMLLIGERLERGILTRDEAIALVAHVTKEGTL